MKKILLVAMFIVSIFSNAQVGIGTNNPASSSILEISSTNKGLLLPRMTNAQMTAIVAPATGLIVYCTDCNPAGLWVYNGSAWASLGSGGGNTPTVVADCNVNGTYFSGIAFTASNTITVTITNNSGSTINGLPAPATSDLALTWTGTGSLSVASVTPAGTYNLANGASRTFTYTLSGTPTSVGTLTTNWTYSDLTYQKVKNIDLGVATFSLPQSKYVVSTYDGSPITDIQGYIDNAANQFIINVPYTGGLGSYSAYTSSVVTGAAGEGGDVNGFTISYPAGTFAASGTIPVTVTVDGDGSYAAKKKLFGAQETIATIPFFFNGNYIENIVLGVIGGIPDRAFGLTINGANNHNFIYSPVTGADGKIWLNNNLGAHYANLNHVSFNPTQQATSATDHLAYGSLFQWGRKADGHELITYTNGTTATPVNGTTTTNANAPTDALFIVEPSYPYDWRTSQDDTLWATQASANNPCPVGFRVPTLAELNTLVTASGITNSATAASSALKFTVPGFRSYNGSLYDVGGLGAYYSSTVYNNISVRYYNFNVANVYQYTTTRAYAQTVRCIKD